MAARRPLAADEIGKDSAFQTLLAFVGQLDPIEQVLAAAGIFCLLVNADPLRGSPFIGHRRRLHGSGRLLPRGRRILRGGGKTSAQQERGNSKCFAHDNARHSRVDCELPPFILPFMV